MDVMDNHYVPNITLSPDFIRGGKRGHNHPAGCAPDDENPQASLHQYNMLDEKRLSGGAL